MVEKVEDSKRVKCPWCAELIMPDALICPFCRSKVTDLPVAGKAGNTANTANTAESSASRPGMLRAMVLNLVCPGLGAWRLGHKGRGAIFFFLITACLMVYAHEVIPLVQKEFNTALRTGNTSGLIKLETSLKSNSWLDFTFYLYVWSFLDIIFLVKNAKKAESGSDS